MTAANNPLQAQLIGQELSPVCTLANTYTQSDLLAHCQTIGAKPFRMQHTVTFVFNCAIEVTLLTCCCYAVS